MTEKTFTEIAKEVRSQFETKYRLDNDNEEVSYFSLSSDRFDSLQELVYSLHNDELPNDWVYGMVCAVLDGFIDYGDEYCSFDEIRDNGIDHDIADDLTPCSNWDIMAFYSESASRLQYAEDAKDEYGDSDTISKALQIGIYYRILSIVSEVGSYLEDQIQS